VHEPGQAWPRSRLHTRCAGCAGCAHSTHPAHATVLPPSLERSNTRCPLCSRWADSWCPPPCPPSSPTSECRTPPDRRFLGKAPCASARGGVRSSRSRAPVCPPQVSERQIRASGRHQDLPDPQIERSGMPEVDPGASVLLRGTVPDHPCGLGRSYPRAPWPGPMRCDTLSVVVRPCGRCRQPRQGAAEGQGARAVVEGVGASGTVVRGGTAFVLVPTPVPSTGGTAFAHQDARRHRSARLPELAASLQIGERGVGRKYPTHGCRHEAGPSSVHPGG
jgi:hypothetical protein